MKKKVFLLCLFVILSCVFCLSACTKNNEKVSFSYENADKYSTEKTEYYDYVSEVEVNWLSGSVKFVAGDVSGVKISETASKENVTDDYKVRSYLDGSKLYIAFSKPGKLNLLNLKKDLTVTFPAAMQVKKIVAKTVAADVEMENTLKFVDSFTVETVSGKVKGEFSSNAAISVDAGIESLALVNFNVKTISGDIIATFSQTTSPVVDMETVSGKMNVVAMNMRDMEVKTVSGDLTLTIPESLGHVATLESVTGKIESDFKELTHGDGKVRIAVESVTANVSIKKA